MTSCERYDRLLALYVEGDLPVPEAGSVARHLEGCTRCRSFLDGLQRSQSTLKDLGAQPLDDVALAAVRSRVLAKVREPASARATSLVWRGAIAAVLVCGVAAAALVFRSRHDVAPRAAAEATTTTDRRPGAETPGSAGQPAPLAAWTLDRQARSTPRPVRTVSRDVAAPQPTSSLTEDEADQLAKAVVLVSRVQRLSDLRPSGPERPGPVEPPTAGRVVLATADPNVVIYWQLDPNGG